MIYRFLLLVMLITVGFPRPLKAEVTTDGAILIITSYNPETRSILTTCLLLWTSINCGEESVSLR